ncbi:MAG: hypothetical protein H0V44_06325 [Planctomycetes bacterium]|nr:hypothetical protein [Planctomycetota bacterium]
MTSYRAAAPSRLLTASMAAVAAWSGDAAPAAPVEVRIADGSTLVAHWNASIYHTLWNDPALAEARARYEEACLEAAKTIGFDPREGLASMSSARMAMTGLAMGDDGKPKPHITVSADFGELAAKLFALAAAKGVAATVAGADEALTLPAQDTGAGEQRGVLARYGSLLVAALNTDPAKTGPLPKADSDLRAIIDIAAVLRMAKDALPPEQTEMIDAMLQNPQLYSGTYRYDASIVPEGLAERIEQTTPWLGSIPVDREVVARLPATTMLVLSSGIDGKALWTACRPIWMLQASQAMSKTRDTPITPDQAEEEINTYLATIGLTCTIADLVQGFNGTSLFTVGQGAPFPSVTIAIPRSPALDQLVGFGLQQVQVEPPAEGTSTMLPIPNVPMAVNIVCDKDHWVVTSDPGITASWTSDQPGGWADAPVGKLALEKAGTDAVMVGASDTPALIRTISGYAGMVLGMQPNMDAKQKQAVLQALNKLGSSASTGFVVARRTGTGVVMDSRGLFGFAGLPAAAVAFGALMSPKAAVQKPEMTVVTTLNQLFVAQAQFQASAYVDQDGDGLGEYGLLSELGGQRSLPGSPQVSLIAEDLAGGIAHGYAIALYLPNADGGVVPEPEGDAMRTMDAKAAEAQEVHWIAYAWPIEADAGARMFAIAQDGQVRSATYLGEAPRWDDVFNGGGWDADPGWDPLSP